MEAIKRETQTKMKIRRNLRNKFAWNGEKKHRRACPRHSDMESTNWNLNKA